MMKVLKVIGIVFLVLIAVGAFFAFYGLNDIKQMEVADIDISQMQDGTYTGEFKKGRWVHEVEVTIMDQRITGIRSINKVTDKGQKKIVDGAIKAMIEKQSIRIDAVSGASVSTKAFQKAVEDALLGERKKR